MINSPSIEPITTIPVELTGGAAAVLDVAASVLAAPILFVVFYIRFLPVNVILLVMVVVVPGFMFF